MRRLEIGGGPAPEHPDWEQLDLLDWGSRGNPTTHIADMRHMPFKDDTFAEIFARNVLEHVSFLDTQSTLLEWKRVLAPGGQMTVVVPDLLGIFADLRSGTNSFDEFVERLYGSQTYDLDLHRAGFCLESMRPLLEGVGLRIVDGPKSSHSGGGVYVEATK